MNYNRLLFKDEIVYQKWQTYDRSMYDEVGDDVNFNIVTEHIQIIDKEYPIYFLQYPVNDIESAELRKQIFKELYNDSNVCEMLNTYILMLNKLAKFRKLTFETQHTVQKHYYHLQTMWCYIECLESLSVILEDKKSQLLIELYNRIREITDSEIYSEMKRKSESLKHDFTELQNIVMEIDLNKGLIKLEKKTSKPFHLYEYVKESFGFDINSSYSIVNSNPITALEESIINYYCMENPDIIENLNQFYTKYNAIDVYEFINLKLQIKFYTSYISFVKNLESEGCNFTLPEYNQDFIACDAYDLSLALSINDKSKVVANDINLPQSSIFVLSGPNQGGKTTFVRSIALTVILALNGCYVPCRSCKIPFYDRLVTHFNKNEVLGKGGRLQEELSRIREIIKMITADTLILFNECFASTRRIDGAALSLKLLNKLFDIKCNAGFVTHYYEIADKDKRLISLTSGVESDGENDDIRTYKITPSLPEGNAYARTIALRYGITFEQMEVLIDEHKNR